MLDNTEIPLPTIAAPIMHAVVDFALAMAAAARAHGGATEQADHEQAAAQQSAAWDACCGNVGAAQVLLAANFLHVPDLEAAAIERLALSAKAVGRALRRAPGDPTVALFAGLSGEQGQAGESTSIDYLSNLRRLLNLRSTLVALGDVEPELVTAVKRRMLGSAGTAAPKTASPRQAYAQQKGSAATKALAVELAGGSVKLSVAHTVKVSAIDGVSVSVPTAQVEHALQLVGLEIRPGPWYTAERYPDDDRENHYTDENGWRNEVDIPVDMDERTSRLASATVDHVSKYNCREVAGFKGQEFSCCEGEHEPEDVDDSLVRPRTRTVDVVVAGTLSVGANTPGQGDGVVAVPFTASLKFVEEISERELDGWDMDGESNAARGLRSFVFGLVLPSGTALTEAEVSLLTGYSFAGIDYSGDDYKDMQGRPQISTKLPILLALTERLVKLTGKPVYGEKTWNKYERLQRIALQEQRARQEEEARVAAKRKQEEEEARDNPLLLPAPDTPITSARLLRPRSLYAVPRTKSADMVHERGPQPADGPAQGGPVPTTMITAGEVSDAEAAAAMAEFADVF